MSIFAPSSIMWRINRENAILLGGPAAAILQIAHPVVALGVEAHSDFRNDTLGRLARTLEAVYTITFSPREDVEAMTARVHASHARVRGRENGRRYSAFSPEAQMWVLATLIALSVETTERLVAPISPEDREIYFREMRVFGTYFGLCPDYGPQNWAEFSAYYQDMLAGPLLGSLPLSAELARHIAFPEKPAALRAIWPLSGFLAAEFLPSPVRERLGFQRTAGVRRGAAILDEVGPHIVQALPPKFRFVRHYREALERV